MVRKKIDNRIRVLIENGVILGHRTMFVVVGDHGKDQVSTLQTYLSFWLTSMLFANAYYTTVGLYKLMY